MDKKEMENIFDFKLGEEIDLDSFEEYEDDSFDYPYREKHWKSQRFKECKFIAS